MIVFAKWKMVKDAVVGSRGTLQILCPCEEQDPTCRQCKKPKPHYLAGSMAFNYESRKRVAYVSVPCESNCGNQFKNMSG